jgi:hypothetical protein
MSSTARPLASAGAKEQKNRPCEGAVITVKVAWRKARLLEFSAG